MTLNEFREVANSLVTDYHYYLESENGEYMSIIIFNREYEDEEGNSYELNNMTNNKFLDCIGKNYKVVNVGASHFTVHVMCEKISQ